MDLHGMYTKDMSNKNAVEVPISADELKIRNELEMKIENDLEEEIKEGIYNLARRLCRIFQLRKERDTKIGGFSEVIIRIKMEESSKIEIKEVKKERNEKSFSFPLNYRVKECLKEVKKIDWEKSLRVGSSPFCVKGSCVNLKHKNGTKNKKLLQLGWKV